MGTLPTGTVTFLFSDIEGSTRLLEVLGGDYGDLLERHHRIFRDAFARRDAVEVGSEGDSFLAVFARATDAVEAAVAIQRALGEEEWPQASAPRVRMGLHTGEARLAAGTYVGLDVHRAARIMAAAHGGQILLSEATRTLVERGLGDGVELLDLGEHRLRDLSRRERLFQIVGDGLRGDFPRLRTVDATPNNLPIQPSELVGREFDLVAIGEHLGSTDVRLLTLTGPGGIGKTRLAVQVAADLSHRFDDGVYFVDLSEARDAAGALQALVEAVGVDVAGRGDLRQALAQDLESKHLLLLFDNFEQVMEAAEEVAALLQRSQNLKVLVTSREPLRLRGEQVFPVGPLAVPEGGGAAPTAADVSRSAAVRLFIERAQQARPDFVLTDDNSEAVAEICARLDGLPLAIELAAARLRLLSAPELRERLRSRLEFLRDGPRDLPARQQTLRGTMEWSYQLLDDEERAIFQLLALFPSARVANVEDVAAALEHLADIDVLGRLASLVDKSLARSLEDKGEQRLSMLGTIREYAAEQLQADPAFHAAARRAHAERFAELATERRGDLDTLTAELGNFQAAWRYFAEQDAPARLSPLLDALWPLYDARGWYHAAVELTNELLDILSRTTPALDRADEEITLRIGVARGLLALRGYTEEVEELYRQALAISERTGAAPKQLPVLKSLASFYLYRGEIDKTIAVGRELLELAEESGDTGLQVEADLILGPALAFTGANEAGLEHLDRAIAHFDPERDGRARLRLGPNPGVAARAISGLLLWIFGHPERAEKRSRSARELAARLDHPYSLAYAGFHVGLLQLWTGRFQATFDQAKEVLRIAAEHDYRIWRAVGLVLQGVATTGLGRPAEGLAQTEEGVSLYENLRTPPIFWGQLLGLRAQAFLLAGRPEEGRVLLERATGLTVEGTWESAELKLHQAEALTSLGRDDEAEQLLLRAYEEAAGAGARMAQLRAATLLARLAAIAGRGSAAATRLQEVIETFDEGFDTPHLLEARALLDAVATSRT
jgi:predicted ATPase/class 3 adenylate cyclase